MAKAGVQKHRTGRWQGVIRDEQGKVIWECLHSHHNRDHWSSAWGAAAHGCAEAALRAEDVKAQAARRGEIEAWLAGAR